MNTVGGGFLEYMEDAVSYGPVLRHTVSRVTAVFS
jgi:hypothetical protein